MCTRSGAAEASETVVVVPEPRLWRLPPGGRGAGELGGCRAHDRSWPTLTAEFKAAGKTFRVSTKYPCAHSCCISAAGAIYYYQLIDSEGGPGAAPEPGDRRHHRRPHKLGDGRSRTNRLKENRPGPRASTSAACLIGHAARALPGSATRAKPVNSALLARRDGRGPKLGGDAPSGGRRRAVVVLRKGHGPGVVAQWLSDRGGPAPWPGARSGTFAGRAPAGASRAWSPRMSSPPASARLFSARRRARVVGLPARSVFVKDGHSTFDDLRSHLGAQNLKSALLWVALALPVREGPRPHWQKPVPPQTLLASRE